jgi:hypothetical protein
MLCAVPGVSVNDAGLAVTPAGKPLNATPTVPLKAFSAVADNCTGCPAAPIVTLKDCGLTASEKSGAGGGAATVSASDAVCVRLPDDPVNVIVADTGAVPTAAVRLNVAAVPGVSVSDDGCAVTPGGRPERATDTFEENPLTAVANTETVEAVPFAVRLKLAGFTLSEKSAAGGGAAWTISDPFVLAVTPFTLVLKPIVAVLAAAEAAAVSVTGSATPGVSNNVVGEVVTPAGNPDTVAVAAPLPEAAVSRREACIPVAPAVIVMLEGESVSVGAVPLPGLLLPPLELPPHDARPTDMRQAAEIKSTPGKTRRSEERNMVPPWTVRIGYRAQSVCSNKWSIGQFRPTLTPVLSYPRCVSCEPPHRK